ncbi:RdgB/HAM1 family non-canonical purine NTP pyrophosphatase [Pelagicoccus sp. SDUM812003]|uniref:RdgB/HAM1 family non-canonical purine NTP pyrophosphatase n=1 Tax=Pelagicoccus sp. SDUM812003 TaxID=3041267 RepID=UPI0028105C12|nr:RdgB/HAM1 family non-canonical purine NTP pyrophosphatase [Pelagicoccus sp. SDUM812003]MDQ8204511.1 RdgB/HAM1 family non-canonical purine NTP pyrophosphatase [Pelagicoccus sp. SDUM812003]
MKLYLATGNLHKIEELQAMLAAANLAVEVHTPAAVGGMPNVVEDQDSFSGNALKKARALAAMLPAEDWALADDSGLAVEILNGAPGVYSARYAGEGASDRDNLEKLLEMLKDVEDADRSASFRCHLALVSPSGEEQVFEGACHGRIISAPAGEGGFGYDPIFVPDGFDKTFAEISSAEKQALSHRGKAMRQLVDWIRSRAG